MIRVSGGDEERLDPQVFSQLSQTNPASKMGGLNDLAIPKQLPQFLLKKLFIYASLEIWFLRNKMETDDPHLSRPFNLGFFRFWGG